MIAIAMDHTTVLPKERVISVGIETEVQAAEGNSAGHVL